MFYPKADCCPFNSDERDAKNMPHSHLPEDAKAEILLENEMNVSARCEMMRKIQEVDFAIIDLNLFLDTHPECKEALDLFTQLASTSKSLKTDHQRKYGPLYVQNSSNSVPFEWVEKCEKWPWEKRN